MRARFLSFASLLFLVVLAIAETPSSIANNPAWVKMSTLAGSWAGTATEDEKHQPVTVSFKLVSDGSVMMSTLGEGTPRRDDHHVPHGRQRIPGDALLFSAQSAADAGDRQHRSEPYRLQVQGRDQCRSE
jgi:hypothetical protein